MMRTVLCCLMLFAGAMCDAGAVTARLLVPAYANPCCANGPAMWSGVIAFAAAQPQELGVIFNPASGPGSGPVDPNYLNDAGQGPLADLLATGAPVYGYVATTYGAKTLVAAQAEIAQYYSSTYWRGSTIHLSGIFFDEMSNDLANVAYYRSLRDAVRQLDANAYIIGNPGVGATVNPSGQVVYTDDDYGTVFNALLVYEDYESMFATGYTVPSWRNASGAAQLAMFVHTTPTEVRMRVAMSRAFSRGAAWVYITDAVLPNPYDILPGFWTSEITLLPELIFVDEFE